MLQARAPDDAEARRALTSLCEGYWPPLYAFLRARGTDPAHAQDLVQGFFVELLGRDKLDAVRPDAGRFRTFLLRVLKHFVIDEARRAEAKKRGGGTIAIEGADLERLDGRLAAGSRSPEEEFERQWAMTVLDRVMERLEADAERKRRGNEFRHLRTLLTEGGRRGDYDALAAELSMTPGAARVAVHRLRKRFGQLLREEIAETVAEPDQIDQEIRHLFAVVRG